MTKTDRTVMQQALDALQLCYEVQEWPSSAPKTEAAIAALQSRLSAEPDDEVMDMALCESETCVLRIGQLYRFRPVGDCATCARMKAVHDEAYAPFGLDTNTLEKQA